MYGGKVQMHYKPEAGAVVSKIGVISVLRTVKFDTALITVTLEA